MRSAASPGSRDGGGFRGVSNPIALIATLPKPVGPTEHAADGDGDDDGQCRREEAGRVRYQKGAEGGADDDADEDTQDGSEGTVDHRRR
ncbi:hypothetical protein GCM10027355_00490 [Haloplanus salinarum]